MNKLMPLLFALVLIASCKSSKNISSPDVVKNISSKEFQKNMNNAAYKFDFVQAKAKVNFNDGKMNQNFTANIRIKNNETIWMSLTGPFGIEGGRVLIEKDRIQIIDRLNNKYYDEKFSYIKNYIPFEVDLALLQNMIIGNNIQNSLERQKIELANGSYLINDNFNGVFAEYTVSKNFRYQKVNLTDIKNDRSINLDFGDYRFVENSLFSMIRNIVFKEQNNTVNVQLDFSKVKKEESLDFPFSVPNKLKN